MWSEGELIPISQKGMGFFVSFTPLEKDSIRKDGKAEDT
jgi:hypothetical protein